MSNQARTISIDRIRLTGFDMTRERAERMRVMIEARVQHLLELENWPDVIEGGELSRLTTPTAHVSMPHSDSNVADGVARSIAQSLRKVG